MIKPDGSWPFTIDYGKLNQLMPVCCPTIAVTPNLLKSFIWDFPCFSALDISNEFWSISWDSKCHCKFASTFEGQKYTTTCLPQGCHNCPSIFHRQMKYVLLPLSRPSDLFQYIDSLYLVTVTLEEHLSLHQVGLKCNPTKAQLLTQTVSFLGITFSKDGSTQLSKR